MVNRKKDEELNNNQTPVKQKITLSSSKAARRLRLTPYKELFMSVTAIPLNTTGATKITVKGIETLECFWTSIIATAHAIYENHGFNEVDVENQDYREAEILNQLQNQAGGDSPDLVIVTLFDHHNIETIEMLIKHGENKVWDF